MERDLNERPWAEGTAVDAFVTVGSEHYVVNPATKNATVANLRNIDARADNSRVLTRGFAIGLITVLSAALMLGCIMLVNEMRDPPVWARLFLLATGLLSALGLGLSCWRVSTRLVEGTEVGRVRSLAEVLGSAGELLPIAVLGNFHISPTASADDVWAAASQLRALEVEWERYAILSDRPNLTLHQELELIEARDNARAVLDHVGALLNPGATPPDNIGPNLSVI